MTSAYTSPYDESHEGDGDEVIPVPRSPNSSSAEPGTRAVIYLRVSWAGQVNTDYDPEGISIPAQRDGVSAQG